MNFLKEENLEETIVKISSLMGLTVKEQTRLKNYLLKIKYDDIITIHSMKMKTGLVEKGMCVRILMHLHDMKIFKKIFYHKCTSCGKRYVYYNINDEKVSTCEDCSSQVKSVDVYGLGFWAKY